MEGDNTNELYKECLRNHAASLGSYATDGCGEFTLNQSSPAALLQCAACGCHRSFHRKVTNGSISHSNRNSHYLEGAANEVMLGGGASSGQQLPESPESDRVSNKKRHRTKFTSEQKEKMLAFSEKLGWKMLRNDEEGEIEKFCKGVGLSRKVFKVWMHNHKNSSSTSIGNAPSLTQ